MSHLFIPYPLKGVVLFFTHCTESNHRVTCRYTMDELQSSSPRSSVEDTLPSGSEAEQLESKNEEVNEHTEHCCCQQADSPGVPLVNLDVPLQAADEPTEPILPIATPSDQQLNAADSKASQDAKPLETPSTQSVSDAKETPAVSVLKGILPVDLCDHSDGCAGCINPTCPHCPPLLPASCVPQMPNVFLVFDSHLVRISVKPPKRASSGTAGSCQQSQRQRTPPSDDRHSHDRCRWNACLSTLPFLHHALSCMQRSHLPTFLQVHSASDPPIRFACQAEIRV